MEQFADVQCWIKLIEQPSGKAIPSGTSVKGFPNGGVTIRYVVANDSNKATGDFYIIGTLKKEGESLPHPVPATKIQLQPKEMWKHEHTVDKTEIGDYSASLSGDVFGFVAGGGGFVKEENENNNKANAKFSILFPVPPQKEP